MVVQASQVRVAHSAQNEAQGDDGDLGRKLLGEGPQAHHAGMTNPREILAFGVVAVVLVLAVHREEWLGWSAAVSMQVLYPLALAAEFAIWSEGMRRHVEWLSASEVTARRGLGKWGCRIYGLFGMPALSPLHFSLVLLGLVVSLLVSVRLPLLATPVAFLLACLTMSQLFWDRQNIGGHGGLPLLHTLFCLTLRAPGNEALTRECIKTILAASYASSGLCKLVTSLLIQSPRQWWGTGECLKFYLLDSLSVRPMKGIRRSVREGILATGRRGKPLLDCAMNCALAFELGAPLLIFGWPRLATLLLFGFHYSAWFLFDIDFLSFWGPSLLALAVDAGSGVPSSPSGMLRLAAQALEDAPLRSGVLLAYTLVQVGVSISVYDLNPVRRELLPFSAYPMFEEATRMFRPEQAIALVLRVPSEKVVPEPYYLRMMALREESDADGPSSFAVGTQVLRTVEERMIIVGIPGESATREATEDYVGGVWRPSPSQQPAKTGLDWCAEGVTKICGHEGAPGEQGLNHERECQGERGEVILVGNVLAEDAQHEVQELVDMIVTMRPEDAWNSPRIRELLRAYETAQAAVARCPTAFVFRTQSFFRPEPIARA